MTRGLLVHGASRSRLLAIGLLSATVACPGATTSLDTSPNASPATETTSAVASSTGLGQSADDTMGGEPPLVICAEECTPLLQSSWTYEGPSDHYVVTELLRDADGSLWLGTQRAGGKIGLSQLSATGELVWSAMPGLPCEPCELTDIALHPSGDVLLSATQPAGVGPPQALVARLDVTTRELLWVRSLTLGTAQSSTRPRTGALVVLDEDRILQLRVNVSGEEELVDVLDLDADGTLQAQRYISVHPGTSSEWPPLGERGAGGEPVLAYMGWDAELERAQPTTSRLLLPNYSILSQMPLALPLDDLAVDGAGRRLELMRSRGTDSITLLLTSRRSSDPERWSTSLPLLSTSSTRAALALGPDDDVYVGARTTPRLAPGETAVSVSLDVARWSSEGRLRWQATRSLDMMATFDPIELAVDEDDGVIVATVIQGRLHVVRYEQACACE